MEELMRELLDELMYALARGSSLTELLIKAHEASVSIKIQRAEGIDNALVVTITDAESYWYIKEMITLELLGSAI